MRELLRQIVALLIEEPWRHQVAIESARAARGSAAAAVDLWQRMSTDEGLSGYGGGR